MNEIDPFGLPPEEALRWFRQKGLSPSFDWRDRWAGDHAKAFTVAKATQLDVLADLYQAVSNAIETGQSLGEFRKQLRPLLADKGWWGEKEQTDPTTGEVTTVQLGSARRLRTIYDTNLKMANAAGRWERIQRVAARRPWLRYVAITRDGRTRQEHLNWAKKPVILRFDDPWWKTHYPPNGWGCRCSVQQLSDRDLERYGLTPSEYAPEDEFVLWKDERNGIVRKVPKGIDPGFDYNVGEARGPDWAPEKEPATDASRSYRDYGRPAASRVTDRLPAPEQWDPVYNPEDIERVRQQFRDLLGGDEATVKDPTGDEVLFTQRYLDHLINKKDRGDVRRAAFVPSAKAAIEKPYEVWLVPFRQRDGRVQLRKRYIALFEGADGGYMVVVDRDSNGYATWTSYPRENIDSKREGYLLFPR